MVKIICSICKIKNRVDIRSISKISSNYILNYNVYICRDCKEDIIENKLRQLTKKKSRR